MLFKAQKLILGVFIGRLNMRRSEKFQGCENAKIRRAIVDKNVSIPDGEVIGYAMAPIALAFRPPCRPEWQPQ